MPLVAASPGTSHVVDVASVWLFFFAAPFAAGRWVGRGTLLASELRDNVDELARQQRERARRAASEERARIARELHDVVAHNVSVMVVQTQAARRVAAGDLAAAGTALQAVSNCGRDALVDMRRMIGVLHRGDVELAAPGLAQLPALVERAEASGLRRRPAGARGDAAAAAVRRPGLVPTRPGGPDERDQTRRRRQRVASRSSTRRARSSWTSPMTAAGRSAAADAEHAAGHGLIGMRERLALYGGEMHAGGRPGGGFQITARIPIDEDRSS